MNRIAAINIVTLAIVFFTATGVLSESKYPVKVKSKSGVINWTTRTATASGSAFPVENAPLPQADKQNRLFEKAKQTALDNLYKTIVSIHLDSDTPLLHVVEKKKEHTAQLYSMINSSPITRKEYMSDGSVELSVQLSLDGGFAQLLLPEGIKQIQPVKTFSSDQSKNPYLFKSIKPDLKKETQFSKPYTGLVIDARGLDITPVMAPRLINEDGIEAYGPAYISREYAVQYGTMEYISSIKEIENNPRSGSNPIIVKGLKTSGAVHSNIIISNADASKILSVSDNLVFLSQCRVVVVIDHI